MSLVSASPISLSDSPFAFSAASAASFCSARSSSDAPSERSCAARPWLVPLSRDRPPRACWAAIPWRIAAQRAGGHTAAQAARFLPEEPLTCNAACSWIFGSLAARP
eukprot:12499807-Alexandrium_andersonii.AAC.1